MKTINEILETLEQARKETMEIVSEIEQMYGTTKDTQKIVDWALHKATEAVYEIEEALHEIEDIKDMDLPF